MKINKDSFCDELMRAEFDNDASIDLSFFNVFFWELLFQFEKNPSGRPAYEIIQNDWHLFSDIETAREAIHSIMVPGVLSYEFDDLVDYSSDIKNKVESWSRLKEDVRRQRRFLADYDEFSQYAYLTADAELKKGDRLYRARINPKRVVRYKMKEMGCPPPEMAVAGRANPVGISYLYLSADEMTTYYEVRASYLDRISIGTFRIERDLKIVDFDTKVSLYLAYTDGDGVKNAIIGKLILDEISHDMSRPMRRFDSDQEYIPTQMICEYCKLIIGADGVSFKSSVHDSGRNYVIFDKNNARCIKVINREISSVVISVK